ncbi:FliM/FliN family flagellar motor switch protein [Jannaschia donghaensis]|uniref:Flagellar motor switch protein FliM n=1 Tax=Jannaschia donghaensis TaxID=420998 RepID=A0A0M6YEH8_9RHOB|nr:FliM/FliN family flagellar motor switch protein [Jannaschia donghaensis]CTQ48752.1 flagellar motor switch protein FliM [Jannaschia donghaensis]
MAGGRAAGAPPAADAPPAPGLERALATAALRVGDGIAGLGLGTADRSSRRLDAAAAFEGFDEKALCLMIDPPDLTTEEVAAHSQDTLAALTGLIVLPPSVTDALIEVQTIGRVDGPARAPRRPTRIDAALVQPFARSLLEQVRRLAASDSDEPKIGNLRTGSFLAGPESLSLVLTAHRYLRLDLDLKLGDGVRSGTISVLVPLDEMALPQVGDDIDPEAGWKASMRATAMDAPVLLQAVLPPLRLPLSRLLSLKVGDVIPLPHHALAEVALHGGSSGVTVPGRASVPRGTSLVARLGQLNGMRAVKIAALPGETAGDPQDDSASGEFGGMPGRVASHPPGDLPPAPAREMAIPGGSASKAADPLDLDDLPDLPGLPDLP